MIKPMFLELCLNFNLIRQIETPKSCYYETDLENELTDIELFALQSIREAEIETEKEKQKQKGNEDETKNEDEIYQPMSDIKLQQNYLRKTKGKQFAEKTLGTTSIWAAKFLFFSR